MKPAIGPWTRRGTTDGRPNYEQILERANEALEAHERVHGKLPKFPSFILLHVMAAEALGANCDETLARHQARWKEDFPALDFSALIVDLREALKGNRIPSYYGKGIYG